MGLMPTTIIFATLAGYGAYSFWETNHFIELCFASICGVTSIIALSDLLFMAVAITFKLNPLIIVGVVGCLIYLASRSRNNTISTDTTDARFSQ